MKFLKKAENLQAYAKVGIFGFQGSGKTHTAMLIAQGLCDLTGNRRIAFFDTETGSDWWTSRVNGYDFYQIKSRAFKDLMGTLKECESEGIGVLVIDSITHVWREILESYLRRVNRKRLMYHDWGPIKTTWGEYTDLFINSQLHCVVCGRAGNIYEYQTDESGNKELINVGTKMKAESEFGFEPSLVIEMEASRGAEVGAGLTNTAHIVKDRSNTINGKSFVMPTFESFRPHFDGLIIGGKHVGVDTTRTSEDLFHDGGDSQYTREQREQKIALDEIQEELVKHFPGRTSRESKHKGDLLEAALGTRSWQRLSSGVHCKSDEMRWGLLKLRWFLNDLDSDSKMEALTQGVDETGICDANAATVAINKLFTNNFPDDTPAGQPEL